MLVLVTGATGYVGSWIIKHLLEDGSFNVRGTVRKLKNTAAYEPLKEFDKNNRLEFAELELESPENVWDKAMEGVDVVMHVATSIDHNSKKPMEEIINPCITGVTRMLNAAKKANVKKILFTSSITAVSNDFNGSPPKVFGENDYNEKASVSYNPYGYAKTQADKLISEFCTKENIPFATFCCGSIFGPPLLNVNEMLRETVIAALNGAVPAVIDLYFFLIDVRDVAKFQVLSIKNDQAVGRFLLVANNIKLLRFYQILAQHVPEKLKKRLPKSEMNKFIGLFFTRVFQGRSTYRFLADTIGKNPVFENAKITSTLNQEYTPHEKTIADMAEYIVKNAAKSGLKI